jgi:uncharacterized membrane protein YfcA
MRSDTLYRVIAVLLVAMAVILMVGHSAEGHGRPLFDGPLQIAAGLAAGFAIGVVASLLGVAGGELLIPTLILLFGVDVKLAGSLSLAISLPTMIVGFGRYSRDSTFAVLSGNRPFVLAMAVGSVVGSFIGALLLGIIPSAVLLPVLAVILLISSVKLWLHRRT